MGTLILISFIIKISMDVIGLAEILEARKCYPDCHNQIDSWISEVKKAQWSKFFDIRERYQSADLINGNNVIFNIKGGNYRLWVKVDFKNKIVLIKKFGTHREYMTWRII